MSECEDCEQLDYAAIVSDAMRVERERIIKLLEAELDEHGFICGSGAYFIDVIKGEENDK